MVPPGEGRGGYVRVRLEAAPHSHRGLFSRTRWNGRMKPTADADEKHRQRVRASGIGLGSESQAPGSPGPAPDADSQTT